MPKKTVTVYGLDKLSLHDRLGVQAAQKWPFTTLSEWEANLAERFETPHRPNHEHDWWVVREGNTVSLRHPILLVVLSVTIE